MEKENGMTWSHGSGLLGCSRKEHGYKSPGSRKAECLFSKLFHLMAKTTAENPRASVLTQKNFFADGLHLAVINTKMITNYIAGNTQIFLYPTNIQVGLPWWLSCKESACSAGDLDLILGSKIL